MKMLPFLIHLFLAQSIALGIGKVTKDKFEITFHTTFTCLLIWDALLGIVYLATPEQHRHARAFRFLFSATMAWIVPIVLIVALVFIPPQTLQSFLHFGR
jgi:hypothetical protein